MSRKRRIFSYIEYYLNEYEKDALEQIYGKGSKIKIHDIFYSTNQKSVMVEAVIILGDIISEETLDRTLADILIQDALVYFYPDEPIKVSVRYDV